MAARNSFWTDTAPLGDYYPKDLLSLTLAVAMARSFDSCSNTERIAG
jgi:hypothetical protein